MAMSLWRHRRPPVIPLSGWLGFGFVMVAVVVTMRGVHPELGVPKLRKLLWFAGLPVAATLVTNADRMRTVLGAYAWGVGVLAAQVCVRNPLRAAAALRDGMGGAFFPALVHHGSMTNGQRLMLGMLAALAFLFARREQRRRAWAWCGLIALQAAALVVNFKRGSWICALVVVTAFVAARRGWRRVWLPLAVVVALLALLPPVRARLGELRAELGAEKGGRLVMWTRVAPALVREYPGGVGYRSLTNRMMREIDPRIEPDRDHLHSNPLQVLVATGWLGLALYLAWMFRGLWDAGRLVRYSRAPGKAADVFAVALLFMLCGLMLNGLVEYNVGDGELVLAYGLLLGCAGRHASQAV
jgi:hypothetical protein